MLTGPRSMLDGRVAGAAIRFVLTACLSLAVLFALVYIAFCVLILLAPEEWGQSNIHFRLVWALCYICSLCFSCWLAGCARITAGGRWACFFGYVVIVVAFPWIWGLPRIPQLGLEFGITFHAVCLLAAFYFGDLGEAHGRRRDRIVSKVGARGSAG
jgi:hypothetical protein